MDFYVKSVPIRIPTHRNRAGGVITHLGARTNLGHCFAVYSTAVDEGRSISVSSPSKHKETGGQEVDHHLAASTTSDEDIRAGSWG